MSNQGNKRPVTLEDLLKLKRAERPPAEFWSQFDRELRAKQLAALVEQRPWWRTLPRVFAGFSRYQLPLGATAVFALSLVSVRYFRPAAAEGAPQQGATIVANATESGSVPASRSQSFAVMEQPVAAPRASREPAIEMLAQPATAVLADATGAAAVDAPSESTGISREIAKPSERFIAANLAIAKSSDPAIAHGILGSARGFEARAMPVRAPAVDPLAQMSSPSDARRSRLLGGSVMSVSMNNAPAARPVEFRSRRISDEQLYDTISRFGARGNSLLVKF